MGWSSETLLLKGGGEKLPRRQVMTSKWQVGGNVRGLGGGIKQLILAPPLSIRLNQCRHFCLEASQEQQWSQHHPSSTQRVLSQRCCQPNCAAEVDGKRKKKDTTQAILLLLLLLLCEV